MGKDWGMDYEDRLDESREMEPHYGVFLAQTFPADSEGAILFLPDGWDEGDEIWLPKSQVKMNDENPLRGDEVEIEIPKWLVEEHGLE